jgi:tetratricopeptide (TPR) repeat protein
MPAAVGCPVLAAAETAPTFSRDIAPLVFKHCAVCHRPGQSAPFPLLTYDDCRKHAKDMAEVTHRRFMPPWLPDGPPGEFVGDRRLTEAEIALLAAWVKAGSPEGDAKDLPTAPVWPTGWRLGQPDLVARMLESYPLKAAGEDTYRCFVLPVRVDRPRWVKAFEFRPGSAAVHHAFVLLSRTNIAAQLDAAEPGPGFGGMDMPKGVQSPGGFFLSWQPGKTVRPLPPGMAWKLEPGFDVVVQLHMITLGKVEPVQSELALWFTDEAPLQQPLKLGLSTYDIDLPAGASNVVVGRDFTFTGDVDLLAVLPHAHYLGRHLQGMAIFPDGRRRSLLDIPEWDFNWQGDYQFAQPVFLPAGTRLEMRYQFDNSAGNPRNPSQPPRRVAYGVSTRDEMAELWLQFMPRTPKDRAAVNNAMAALYTDDVISYNQYRLRSEPGNAGAYVKMGVAELGRGRVAQAERYLEQALAADPKSADARVHRAVLRRMRNDETAARQELLLALAADPNHSRANGEMGIVAFEAGQYTEAAKYLSRAVELDRDDYLARNTLGVIRFNEGKQQEGLALCEEAARLAPDNAVIRNTLAQMRKALR